ncbi:hypothetical protein AB0B85_00625 [Micromonospora sp. NPDC049044]|uniref:hypothetical protein n=1 Tax=unclassified Micromonospora TaxID=2617518 RepID=UPI0033E81D1B
MVQRDGGRPAMRYHLLGPVEVWSPAGERLALGTPMQVRLLAVLLVVRFRPGLTHRAPSGRVSTTA